MQVKLVKTGMTDIRYGYNATVMKNIGDVFYVTRISNDEYKDEKGFYYHKEDLQLQVNALAELERFQTDRLLHKNKFDLRIATMNILEELLEAHGVGDNKERELVKSLYNELESIVEDLSTDATFCEDKGFTYNIPTVEDQVDAFCDIQVFAGGEIGKLGYSNEQCLIEVGKEINSRTGEIVNGKFEKYKTEEAMAKWYKADFSGCKLRI